VCEREPGQVNPATQNQGHQPRQVEEACQQMHADGRRGCGKNGLERIYERWQRLSRTPQAAQHTDERGDLGNHCADRRADE